MEQNDSPPTDSPTSFSTFYTSFSSSYEYDEPGPPAWGKSLLILDLILCAISVLCVFASWIFLCKYRKRRIVALGQPNLLALYCLGGLTMVVGIFCRLLIIMHDEHVVMEDLEAEADSFPFDTSLNYSLLCNFYEWMVSFGWLTMLSILMGKLYRVYRVPQFRRNQVVHTYLILVPYVVFIVGYCGIALAIELSFPGDYHFQDNRGTVVPPYRSCANLNDTRTRILHGLLSGFNGVLILTVLILAWKLRDIQEDLAETRKIVWIVALDIFTVLAEVVIHSVVVTMDSSRLESWDRVFLFGPVVVAFDLIFVLVALGLMLLPRMHAVWYENKHGELPVTSGSIGTGAEHVRDITTDGSKPSEETKSKDDEDNDNGNGNDNHHEPVPEEDPEAVTVTDREPEEEKVKPGASGAKKDATGSGAMPSGAKKDAPGTGAVSSGAKKNVSSLTAKFERISSSRANSSV
eukprot:jgi/Psemu1/288475/fgenesh1_pg.263_\